MGPDRQSGGRSLDLGVCVLRKGASVVGWVEDDRGDPLSTDASVASMDAESTKEVPGLTTHPNQRGFFQIVSVPPGPYHLVARRPGAVAGAVSIAVASEAETRVRDSIGSRPQRLCRSSWTRQWPPRVKSGVWKCWPSSQDVLIRWPPRRWRGPVAGVRSGLGAGRYHVTIVGRPSEQWWGQEVELAPGESRDLSIELALLTVSGRVTLAGRSLGKAKVTFGDGALSAVKLSTQTDEEGSFSLRLPRSGKWTAEIECCEPSVMRTVRVDVDPSAAGGRTDIQLSDGVVKGAVRDEAGSPVAARVQITADGGGDPVASARSAADGTFEIHGMPSGPMTVTASLGRLISDPVTVLSAEQASDAHPVELVLRGARIVRGVVVSSGGVVPKARVAAFPLLAGGPIAPKTTDNDGRFEVAIPAGASELAIAVTAVGHAYKMTRLQLIADDTVVVLLENEADAVGHAP